MMGLLKLREFQIDTVLALLIAIFYMVVDGGEVLSVVQKKTDVVISISLTLLGFLMTSLAILLAFPENDRIQFLRKHPTYPKIHEYYLFTIGVLLALAVTSFIASYITILLLVVFWLLVWSLTMLVRCIWLLKKMIDLYTREPPETVVGD